MRRLNSDAPDVGRVEYLYYCLAPTLTPATFGVPTLPCPRFRGEPGRVFMALTRYSKYTTATMLITGGMGLPHESEAKTRAVDKPQEHDAGRSVSTQPTTWRALINRLFAIARAELRQVLWRSGRLRCGQE